MVHARRVTARLWHSLFTATTRPTRIQTRETHHQRHWEVRTAPGGDGRPSDSLTPSTMEAALLAALEGIQRKLESLETKVVAVQATQAAQGQGLADVRRGLDELRLRGPAQPPQGAPAAAEGAATAAAAAAALGGQAAEPRSEGAAAAHEAGTPPDEYEMPDDAAGGPAPALGEQPAASGGAPTAARMQHGGGAPQQAGAGVPAAAAPAAAPTGESPGQPRRRLQPQRLQPQQLPPEQQSDEEGGEAAEEPAVGAGQGPFPAVETFRADQVLKLHENFIATALPRRPPGLLQRVLWLPHRAAA